MPLPYLQGYFDNIFNKKKKRWNDFHKDMKKYLSYFP